jgi:hypothetical protein
MDQLVTGQRPPEDDGSSSGPRTKTADVSLVAFLLAAVLVVGQSTSDGSLFLVVPTGWRVSSVARQAKTANGKRAGRERETESRTKKRENVRERVSERMGMQREGIDPKRIDRIRLVGRLLAFWARSSFSVQAESGSESESKSEPE